VRTTIGILPPHDAERAGLGAAVTGSGLFGNDGWAVDPEGAAVDCATEKFRARRRQLDRVK